MADILVLDDGALLGDDEAWATSEVHDMLVLELRKQVQVDCMLEQEEYMQVALEHKQVQMAHMLELGENMLEQEECKLELVGCMLVLEVHMLA